MTNFFFIMIESCTINMSCLYLLSFIAFTAAFTSLGSYFHVLKQKTGTVRPLFSFVVVIVDPAKFDMLAGGLLILHGKIMQCQGFINCWKNPCEVQSWVLQFRILLNFSTGLIRGSRSQMFIKTNLLKILQYSQENNSAGVSF